MKIKREQKGKSLWAFPDDYTVVDIETNFTEWRETEIIEISAVRFRNNKFSDSFSVLVKVDDKIDRFVSNLTGITDEMLQNYGIDVKEALKKFSEFVGNDIILGYNVSFDINTIYDSMVKYDLEPLKNDFVDVLRFSRKALRDYEVANRKQTTVAEFFGIDVNGAHRAEKDCFICNEIYQRLRYRLQY